MGRSNQRVFPWYSWLLPKRTYSRVAVLGATQLDGFTSNIDAGEVELYDITLSGENHWNINESLTLRGEDYDLIVSTRCPYFAADPLAFITSCRDKLKPGGVLFLDWGLGDHWRLTPYKVGWVRGSDHEYVNYGQHTSTLHSCVWSDRLCDAAAAKDFRNNIRRYPEYDDDRTLTNIINAEVPRVFDLTQKVDELELFDVQLLSLWPDAPQLYIATVFTRST